MKHQILATLVATGLLNSLSGTSFGQAIQVDPKLPEYKAVSGVSGNLNSVGSDTLNNLMTLWAEGFKAVYPNVRIQIEGKGTSTAPPALIAGTSQLGPMSREMKAKEIDDFEKKFGYKPTPIKVAIDALAVYVNKDNPIKQMTMAQVDGAFSSTRKLGGDAINTWGQLGLTGEWAGKALSLYGRNSASGTYGFFKDKALGGGDFRAEVKEQPGSSAVVQGVTSDLAGIGYSGIGYRTSGVRPVPLVGKDGKAYDTTQENCASGKYPLSRFLYVYINKAPNKPVDPLTAEFIKFILSKQGQEVVVKDGYFPLPATIAAKEAALVSK
jgi:phosphate transport system substrate-binding protein